MAITVSKFTGNTTQVTGITDGNETIFTLDPSVAYFVAARPTSAGVATLKATIETAAQTDFANMAADEIGEQSAAFMRKVEGATNIGIDVASGTWVMTISEAV